MTKKSKKDSPKENTAEVAVKAPQLQPYKWPKGFCPNPKGRPPNPMHTIVQQKALSISVEAIEYLKRVLFDEGEPTKNRLIATGMILDRALGKAPQALKIETKTSDVDPKQMTGVELAAKIAELEALVAEAKSNKTVIEGTVVKEKENG